MGWEETAAKPLSLPSPAAPLRWEDQYGTAWRDPWHDSRHNPAPTPVEVASLGVTQKCPTPSSPHHSRTNVRTLWSRFSHKTTRPQRVVLAVALVILLSVVVVLLLPHESTSLRVAQLNHALSSGQEITPADVEWVTVPASLAPDHPITSAEQFKGRRVVGDVERGELLTAARLTTPRLPDGWRALTLPISGATSWRPGQHVDIVASTEDSSWTLCHDAVIHDTTASGSQGNSHPGGVVVALPEEKAYELAQLDADAVVTLLLR